MLSLLKLIPLDDWLWIALALGLFGYHEYAIHEARVEAKAQIAVQLAQVQAKADSDHNAMQAKLDAAAKVSNADLSKQFTDIQGKLDKLKSYDMKFKTPLPVDCKYDAQRVSQTNQALAQ